MPVGRLNNAPTQDNYVDALTVRFPFPRTAFSVQVSNAGAYYQVASMLPTLNMRDFQFEPADHYTVPALLTFNDPTTEGFAPGALFMGIRFRSGATGVPANVTVQT